MAAFAARFSRTTFEEKFFAMRYILSLALAALFVSSSYAQLFMEDWDDGNGAMRWSDPIVDAENGTFDGSVDYAFDYSTVGVAPAPNSSGTTTGLFMEVNTSVQEGDQGETVAILADSFTIPAGNFVLTMDAYFNVNNLTNPDTGDAPGGSTEYGTFGIFASGPTSAGDAAITGDAPFRFGLSDGDGLAWQVTGEGGARDDVIRYLDPGNMNTGGETLLGSYDSLPNGTIPGVPTGEGDPTNPFAFGPEEQWVEIGLSSINGMVSFSMNGYVFETYDNTGGELNGGTIMLGYSDPFNSVNLDVGNEVPNFLLIDNVVMSIPEPSGSMLCGLAMFVGLTVRVRRRR